MKESSKSFRRILLVERQLVPAFDKDGKPIRVTEKHTELEEEDDVYGFIDVNCRRAIILLCHTYYKSLLHYFFPALLRPRHTYMDSIRILVKISEIRFHFRISIPVHSQNAHYIVPNLFRSQLPHLRLYTLASPIHSVPSLVANRIIFSMLQ